MPEIICVVDGCENAVHVKRLGLCRSHYARARRHGDPVAGGPMRERQAPARAVRDHEDGSRTCNACELRKPLVEFPKDRNGTLGHRSHCKVCHTAKQTARYQSDPEGHRAQLRERRLRDPEGARAYDRLRYERDRDKRIASAIDHSHRRRARLAELPHDPGITVLRLWVIHGDRCIYCQVQMVRTRSTGRVFIPKKATIEHMVPISAGGGHTWDNCRLACWQCNVDKNAKPYEDWLADRGQLALGW